MSEISRSALFGKLNPVGYRALEAATVFCKLRGNPYVELVHWIHQLLQLQDSDLHRIIRHFGLDAARLAADITATLDKLPRGATAISDFSPLIEESVERGWVYGTLLFGENQVRTGHLVVGMLKTKALTNALAGISKEFAKLRAEALADEFRKLLDGSPEAALVAADGSKVGSPGEASGAVAPAQMGKQEALAQFSVDLTEKARKGEIDPIVGRDQEIRQVVDVLMRRRQNNPILIGEAGVGKTAVVEGFALRIVAGDVPPQLKDVTLRTLDVGLLQAGASMKGEFEQRLRQVIEEVQASPKPIILFIDEAHTLVGAGGAAGTGDAANLLKPALARGTLRTVAATTFAEYKKYFEKDPALTRRFQPVQVDEPSEEKAILMMRGITSSLEKHHRVQILDEAIDAAVRLSHRYIPARQLPDKSVSLLDTASARVAVSQHAVPAEVDDSRRRIQALETELEIIGREAAVGIETADRKASAEEALALEKDKLFGLEARWQQEKILVDKVLALRAALREGASAVDGAVAADSPERAAMVEELRKLQAELAEHQGESPLIMPAVDAQAVAAVIGDWTGIPVGRMVKNEVQAVLQLANTLSQRVIGQDHAMEMIAKRVQTSRAKLDNPNKPIGVFMLCGPSGVGKTETALALAEALYGGEQNLITINMSEFQEAHTVSTLKGAPPGYVGYGEGGILTEAVRRKPYSVVLLDEVEKAHTDVHEIFFQVFDKGIMEDGEGRLIDFKNTLILLTSNAGTDLIMSMCADPELIPESEEIAKALKEPLLKIFPPALLGRLITIPYYPLSESMLGRIIRLQLNRIVKRLKEQHKVPFTYTEEVVSLITSRCNEPESGGRMIDAILTNTMLPAISAAFLNRMLEGQPVQSVHVGVENGDFAYSIV
ncbi:type VI secretion system ATPase TssH [Siccirubricoccus sp. KC 17139]|uniref:Type VI secretion system ATPase TssH n=1 Tax=Siccirubricoccus soli TaxID=2899147 RepID=A0ABT1D0V3_9PROT|nr:type VI secretion system ATPase TssH [Siccirubricoccus soli]MCO6415512.1 type VI secretion system ATPase TssH [Siccirubricoccus soli]MCP2681644.1 type VI secretion system ATPase TssH [Siccirubricoccus soli]